MAESISVAALFQDYRDWPLIDVRSPGEYAQAHVPWAYSMPLFDDRQRAEVGIAYKHNGQHQAILKGLDLVGPSMSRLAETGWNHTLEHWQQQECVSRTERKRVVVHCWRGGMRSRSVAWLLEQVGLSVRVLEGGYKAYRRSVLDRFCFPLRFRVLTGLTGAGKTRVLNLLQQSGEQVLDLEAMANHRGSAFGYLGPQPTVEQFENNLAEALLQLDAERIVWVEDEAQSIGKVALPGALFKQYRKAPAVFLELDRLERAKNLAQWYGKQPPQQLADGIREIHKRLGGQNVTRALKLLDANDLVGCAACLLEYYDKAYLRAQEKNGRIASQPLPISGLSDVQLIYKLREFSSEWASV